MNNLNLVENKNLFLIFSGTLVLASIVGVSIFSLKPGIDLTGGTDWQISFGVSNVNPQKIIDAAKAVKLGENPAIKQLGEKGFSLRFREMSEEEHQAVLGELRKLGEVEEKNFSNIGPTIGTELRKRSLWAVFLVMLAISIYIAWAFRKVSEPVKSWKYGVVTLLTLFHDVVIPTGLLALLGNLKGIEIDTNFIVALLVVMGFSVHDTIVVFDRIRENLLRRKGGKLDLGEIINQSVRETFTRSVNTSLTLIIVLLALLFLGPPPLFYFVLTILVGTIFGTYSSIFVASPLLYIWGSKRS